MSEVAGRIAGTIRPDIRELTAYPVAHAEGCIKLDAMESPYELPEAVRDDLARVLRDTPLNRYPAADLSELRQAVKAAFGVPADAGVLFGNGSDELIHIVVQACCNPGEVVLAPWPSFVYFDMAARFDHARFVGVPLTEDLSLDLPAMLAAIREHQPKVVFLAVPNNPTGGAWSDADMAAIIAAAPGLVVVDEAYQPFTDRSWMPRLLDAPNVVVMRTVSKIGLAGLRFGYLAGHPDWVAELDKVRPPYNLDVLTQAALLTVLRHKPVLDQQAARLRADREPLAAALAALPGVRVFPSAANFVLARFSGKLDGNAVHLALKQRKILVRNFSNAHPLLAGCLRISVGSPDENAALLSALQDILSA
ncbi:histidinol-phosphate transaminase [Achromobacter ruhlandii]|uniref:Histidinol-phosphate aminotransferase n=1 Tax=Achromobacter ruhlandii TaxID=72557 RepID=A0ABM8LZG9_9BURK|nr:histidinol-phosphate transaminase [Achromobacter ruhlandii]AKP87735.1 Histidinol-phosphate aminotransferase [Achromobacter xylosoxidans]AOU91080.1 histidinol-phosphate aminotransferase [Achromobacter ruhlandii]MCZ8436048.1 histidinol-phosphate transaminase [Achromobacter ruhlandii]MDC6089165.1 histidinol-phosphate transaminase [Achromobacter ruhlandii]MDC6152199.1 histidinol-phosphate transaminase [Achromobacter ruhlandii]